MLQKNSSNMGAQKCISETHLPIETLQFQKVTVYVCMLLHQRLFPNICDIASRTATT